MLAGYQMGKVSDKEAEMNGKKKKVKHISITGGTGVWLLMAKIDIYFDPEAGDIKVEVDGAGGIYLNYEGLEVAWYPGGFKRNLKRILRRVEAVEAPEEVLMTRFVNHRILEQLLRCYI